MIPAGGGSPKQLTFHSNGALVQDWFPDGGSVLTVARRDFSWNPRQDDRFFQVRRDKRSAEKLLFDTYGREGRLSPDGSKLLFTREGEQWWRKGYRGSQASQIWLYEFANQKFRCLLKQPYAAELRWKPDASGFYFVGGPEGQQLCEYDLATERNARDVISDDSVVFAIRRLDDRVRHLSISTPIDRLKILRREIVSVP